MSAPPRLNIHIGDYIRDTPPFCRATWDHHAIYLMSMFIAWNVPGVRLPDDQAWMAMRFGCTVDEVVDKVMPVIRAYYKLRRGFWYQKRLTKERLYIDEKNKKQSDRAKVRWDKEKDTSHGNATAMPRQSQRNAPPTPSPKEERNNSARGNGVGKKGALNGSHVTVRDPHERLSRFAGKIAEYINASTGSVQGSTIVLAAMDAAHPDHAQAMNACREAAAAMRKGWPRNWPTDGKFFEVQHAEG